MASLTSSGLTASLSVAGSNDGLLKVDTRGRVRTSANHHQSFITTFITFMGQKTKLQ